MKAIRQEMAQTDAECHVLPLGKKANDAYKKLPELNPVGFEEDAWQIFDDLNFDRAQIVAEHIMAQFEGGQYDEVKIVYNRLKKIFN